MEWLRKTFAGALAVAVCLGMVGCAQEMSDGSAAVAQPTPKPTPQRTVSPAPETGSETTVFPCGPPGREEDYFSPFSDLFLEWTPDGQQLMFSHGTAIWIADAAGTQLRMLVDANPLGYFYYGFHADVSPDGLQVVFSTCQFPWDAQSLAARRSNALFSLPDFSPDEYDVALISMDGSVPQRLTNNRYLDHFPSWSPDGTRIAYIAFLDSTRYRIPIRTILTMAADGSEVREIQETRNLELATGPLVWSPDGERLAFQVYDWENWPRQKTLYTARADGSDLQKVAENVVGVASWSPDGQQIALARLVGDELGLYTLAADGSNQMLITAITDLERLALWKSDYKSLINTVSWSPDGTKVLYSCNEGACVVDVGNGWQLGLVSEVVGRYPFQSYTAAWSPDGTRIAIYAPGDPHPALHSRLFTVSNDGTDPSGVVWEDSASGELVPWNASQAAADVDVSACAAGFVVPAPERNPGLVQDCETLLRMRDALAGRGKLSWSHETYIAHWDRVVYGGVPLRVRQLSFNGFGLTGTLPPELGQLSELEVLVLNNNGLTGSIPPALGQLTKLFRLSLSQNYLSGEIPAELGNLSSLTSLELHKNYLEGTIPPELYGLTKLRRLSLRNNWLRGSIPGDLSSLSELQELHLEELYGKGNEFSGCVPAELPDIWVKASGLERCAN